MKRCLKPLIIRKMQIKTMIRYHLTPVRISNIKKTEDGIITADEYVNKREPFS